MTGTQIGAELTRDYTTADITSGRGHAVGETHIDSLGKEYTFVQASAALAQYDAVWVKSNHEAIPGTAAAFQTPGRFAVAQVAITLDQYGWVQHRGNAIVSVLGSCNADAGLYMSATAGHLDDLTLSVEVLGIVLLSAEASSMAACYMDHVVISPHTTS